MNTTNKRRIMKININNNHSIKDTSKGGAHSVRRSPRSLLSLSILANLSLKGLNIFS